jgi:hypothetical protein
MLILNFTYPLRCLRVPPGVPVPPVEYHCSRLYRQAMVFCVMTPCSVVVEYRRFGDLGAFTFRVK